MKNKNILFLILFFAVLSFCFPLHAFGATMELTVNITSVQIPERAAMMLQPLDLEFMFYNSRITVLDKNSYVWRRVDFPTSNKELVMGAQANFAFPYDSTLAPYNVYVELKTSMVTNVIACKADCTPVSVGSNWFINSPNLYFYSYDPQDYWYEAERNPCPLDLPCSNYREYIAFDPANVPASTRWVEGGGTFGYWRSPAIYTIN